MITRFVQAGSSLLEQAESEGQVAKHGKENPNWRGGRSVASNGYMLFRVGVGHHLADVRGYAYEHRVVAEKTIGRRLVKGEVVHHKDGDKLNNAPENLEVMTSTAHHAVEHRSHAGKAKRLPGEENRSIMCKCGCGEAFKKYDSSGRPRKYRTGHNTGARNRG